MLERYRGPLLAGLILAAFLLAFLALVHPKAFAQAMGEYGAVLNDSTSAGAAGNRFKPMKIAPSDDVKAGQKKFQSDFKDASKDFKSAKGMTSSTFKNTKDFDSGADFKTGNDFKSSGNEFKPSFSNH